MPSSDTSVGKTPSAAPVSAPGVTKSSGLGWACLGCLMVPVLLFLAVLGVGAWFIASMGLKQIPVFTSLAYRRPEPIHVVTVSVAQSQPLIPADTLKALSEAQNASDPSQAMTDALNGPALQQLMNRLSSFGTPLAGGAFAVSIPESSLTATLRQAQPPASDTPSDMPFDFSAAQIAVSKQDGIEIFLPLFKNPVGSALILQFRPTVEAQSITGDLTRAQIGNFRVPDAFLSQVDVKTLRPALESAAPSIKGVATFTRVEAQDGFLRLEGKFTPQ